MTLNPASEIKSVTKKNIPAFAEKQIVSSVPGSIIPITRHRALSYAHCPLAHDHDPVLFTAWDKDRLVGYAGALPGILRAGEKTFGVRWVSAIYVLPEYKGTGSKLVREIIETGHDLASAGVSTSGQKCALSTGFYNEGSLEITRIELGRSLFWKWPFLRGILLKKRGTGVKVREIESLSQELYDVQKKPPVFFERPPAVLNWMKQYPWVVESREPSMPPAYYFSDTRLFHRIIFLELSAGRGRGWAAFLISQPHGKARTLKILDHGLDENLDRGILLEAALDLAEKHKAGILEFQKGLFPDFEAALPVKSVLSVFPRPYFYRPSGPQSPLALYGRECAKAFQDGDNGLT